MDVDAHRIQLILLGERALVESLAIDDDSGWQGAVATLGRLTGRAKHVRGVLRCGMSRALSVGCAWLITVRSTSVTVELGILTQHLLVGSYGASLRQALGLSAS